MIIQPLGMSPALPQAPVARPIAAGNNDPVQDTFSSAPATADPSAAMRAAARPGAVHHPQIQNPVVGSAEAAPTLEAGTLHSPRFLGTEAEYFKEAHGLIERARPGDIVALQMYEFENVATNGDHSAARSAPGFADQQALLPALADAAKRGVKVQVLLDASKSHETGAPMNQPIVDYLAKAAEGSGNITVDYYPPECVNIDHAKQLMLLTPGQGGAYQVQEALAGGSNWGNHTPANDDGGGAFYGRDGVGAARIFYRDQAFARGERSSPAEPASGGTDPVAWRVTAPTAEGGGATGIKQAKLAWQKSADDVYMSEFCLTDQDVVGSLVDKGTHAHVRLDPNEAVVNTKALWAVRKAHGEAMWANTAEDSEHMPGQKLHSKLDVYVKDGVAQGATIGSANDTANGLDTTHTATNPHTGGNETRKTNHEIDAVVQRVTTNEDTPEGKYSTTAFLDAALAKVKNDLARHSLENPPDHTSSTTPGNF